MKLNAIESVGVGVVLLFWAARLCAQATPKTDADIAAIVEKCVVEQRRAPGIVIGVLDDKGPRVFAKGFCGDEQSAPVNGDTVFEIGSVTKVFTALLLQEMVDSGEVALNDPVGKYLPSSVKMPSRNGREITLVDIATQTSGLPRMPDNFDPKDANNPYADYTVERMYDFLSHYELTRDVGAKYEYSNLAVGLLGHVLALRAGRNYEAAVTQRVCDPLGMNSTRMTLSPALKARLAPGHNTVGMAVSNWDLGALAGAGGLRSTANDMLKFLAANAGFTHSSLSSAMLATQKPRRGVGVGRKIGLIWQIDTNSGVIWHNGATGGYHSYIGFNKAARRAVVVLANSQNDIDDIGQCLLGERANVEDFKPPKTHTLAQVDPSLYDHYAGTYHFQIPGMTLDVTREGDHLFARLTGQDKYEIFPASETDFFYKVVDAQVTFKKDAAGLVLHQNGADMTATKGAATEQKAKEHQEIQVTPRILDACAGQYKFQKADATITITREGNHLFARLTGQDRYEVFPESETDFFYKVVDAQLTFVKDPVGAVTAVVLHQNGMDQTVNRVK